MGGRSADMVDEVLDRRRARRLAPVVVAAVIVFAVLSPSRAVAQVASVAPNAQPTGGTVVAGTASISQIATSTSVNQASVLAVINWQAFGVGAQTTFRVSAPSSSSVTLLRVVGPDPADIAGHVTSNGTVILTDAAGITVEQGALLIGHGIVLSAAGSTTAHFMAGQLTLDRAPNPNAGIAVRGALVASHAGTVGLVAPAVSVSGTVDAAGGTIVVLGAVGATLDLATGGSIDGPITRVPKDANGNPVAAFVAITGVVRAAGGVIQIEAASADGLLANGVSLGGTIGANNLPNVRGQEKVHSTGSGIEVTGTLQALGGPMLPGGTIGISSSASVTLAATARLNASGRAGGGTIAVGMSIDDAQSAGCPASVRPTTTTVVAGSRLHASATANGAGGTIALGGKTVVFKGSATAAGGPSGGDGGTVVLAATTLSNGGTTDVSSPQGQPGAVLVLSC
ncbi:MAG: hypothetical protein QOE63_1655 [Acidimicrobiaceae bacterium]